MATLDWGMGSALAQSGSNLAGNLDQYRDQLYGQLAQQSQQQSYRIFSTAEWPVRPHSASLLSESKTVMAKIKEEFKKLSSKPIVKEIMPGLIKLRKEEVSIVVNEMLAV